MGQRRNCKRNFKNYFRLMKKKTTYQNLWDRAKQCLEGNL